MQKYLISLLALICLCLTCSKNNKLSHPKSFSLDLLEYSLEQKNTTVTDKHDIICDTIYLSKSNFNDDILKMEYRPSFEETLSAEMFSHHDNYTYPILRNTINIPNEIIEIDNSFKMCANSFNCQLKILPFVKNDTIGITGIILFHEGHVYTHYYLYTWDGNRWAFSCIEYSGEGYTYCVDD